MKLLLLEDDYDYKISIKEYLESLDYEIDDFDNGEDALHAIYDNNYQLLILDIRVPKINGYELVKMIREDNINIPVIYITSLTDINNLSLGYELGCNDYIKKPFSPKELKYRIEQLIKLFYTRENNKRVILNSQFSYDIIKKQLFKHENEILLTKKESEVIFTLISNKNSFVSIEKLRSEVWNDKYICEADIRVCIKKIRDKTSKDFIINQRGIGYKIDRKE
ncbi:DNA-binding response regulator [Malaciobacter molluscorum LMG 25693]|uniref:DNA-binding response regulator n=1 Tax=Malaciobacter molluscorum LMG 25693 TaxID=870501 RepID=A0A2G1DEV3_9BACT|nr:response regulator transcription factor [Malaciobacter molluscorum]AXX92795.1 two-component system response regulator [Malaciobacter molluscorum LMG 25693]PHO17013.1 DNA-binding response regulator [Malaciobacter molluscorum LMG 25693]RXJ96122.1 DNA-binding response regulator [Malaciobacter molluscorum]